MNNIPVKLEDLSLEQVVTLIRTFLPQYEWTAIGQSDIEYVGGDRNIKGGIHTGAIGVIRFFGGQITIWSDDIKHYRKNAMSVSTDGSNVFAVYNLLKSWGVGVV